MARPKSENVQINISIPAEWKKELENLARIARTLKSISAIELFKAFPQLKRFYARCGVLWSKGYFVSTVGHISEATVIKYIEEQKRHD